MADPTSPTDGKRTNSEILWDIAQTFSDEAQLAAKKKLAEQGYATDKGEIPFEETLINLSLNRNILVNAIETAALPQLPLKIQKRLLADAQQVAAQLSALIGGNDAVLPFEGAVDDLTASIWYSNLQNMWGEVLGLQEKLNQLKTLEKALKDLNQKADTFKATEEKSEKGLAKLDEVLGSVENSVANLSQIAQDAQQSLDATKGLEQKTIASLTSAQQNEKNSSESAATARAASGEIDSLKTRSATALSEIEATRAAYIVLTTELTNFKTQTQAAIKEDEEAQKQTYAALDKRSQTELAAVIAQTTASKTKFETEAAKLLAQNKEGLDAVEKKANSIVTENENKTKERFEELIKLEDVIREKIRLATNFQLFHSFQTRQQAIAKGKDFWRNSLFGCVGLSFVLSIVFILYLSLKSTPTPYNTAFFIKLAISIPIIYAIHFCSSQYSKERQLEEEYAFKGNISISLEPYRELIEKMINKNEPVEAAKYSDFVIAAVEKVFTSPTQQILGEPIKKESSTEIADTSKGFTKILGSVNDLIQSLSKLK